MPFHYNKKYNLRSNSHEKKIAQRTFHLKFDWLKFYVINILWGRVIQHDKNLSYVLNDKEEDTITIYMVYGCWRKIFWIFLDELELKLKTESSNYVILTSDLNIDLLNLDNKGQKYLELKEGLGLSSEIKQPLENSPLGSHV